MQLEFSSAAEADLVDIASFIARDNPARAITFVDELEAVCIKLLDYPHAGAARADLRAGLRSRPYGSYVIFYSALTDVVRIERILHGARDIGGIQPLS